MLLERRARDDRLLPRGRPRATDRRRARRVDHHRPRRLTRRVLESHLWHEGCELLREGARHAIWINRERDLRAPSRATVRARPAPSERSAASSGFRRQPAHADPPRRAHAAPDRRTEPARAALCAPAPVPKRSCREACGLWWLPLLIGGALGRVPQRARATRPEREPARVVGRVPLTWGTSTLLGPTWDRPARYRAAPKQERTGVPMRLWMPEARQ